MDNRRHMDQHGVGNRHLNPRRLRNRLPRLWHRRQRTYARIMRENRRNRLPPWPFGDRQSERLLIAARAAEEAAREVEQAARAARYAAAAAEWSRGAPGPRYTWRRYSIESIFRSWERNWDVDIRMYCRRHIREYLSFHAGDGNPAPNNPWGWVRSTHHVNNNRRVPRRRAARRRVAD
jgi:hypothetical protein